MSYSDYLVRLSPTFLQRPMGAAFLRAVGAGLDLLSDRTRQAVKARFPTICPPDALGPLGDERGFVRGPAETDAHFAVRIKDAWDEWERGGTAFGLLTALYEGGFPDAYVEIVGGIQYSIQSGAFTIQQLPKGSWSIDATPRYWAKFQIVWCHPNIPADLNPPPPSNSPVIERLRQTVDQWKPAFAVCGGLVVITQGRTVGFPPGPPIGTRTLGTQGGTLQGNVRTLYEVP